MFRRAEIAGVNATQARAIDGETKKYIFLVYPVADQTLITTRSQTPASSQVLVIMNSSVFMPLVFLLNKFSLFTSAAVTNLTTNGFSIAARGIHDCLRRRV